MSSKKGAMRESYALLTIEYGTNQFENPHGITSVAAPELVAHNPLKHVR